MLRVWVTALLPLLLLTAAAAQIGYFRLQAEDGTWWLIDPNGQNALLIGANGMRLPAAAAKTFYPDEDAWQFEALARLKRWRFNTIGLESDARLWNYRVPYVMDLHIAVHAGADWKAGRPLDVFDPSFAQQAQTIANEGALPRTPDHWLVGYLSDDDIPWAAPGGAGETMLALYLRLPEEAPGRQAAVHFLRLRYHDSIRRWSEAWGQKRLKDFDEIRAPGATAAYRADAEAFLSEVATRYFQTCADAIHQADPNHLYLGAMLAPDAPEPVWIAARIADAVALALTAADPRPALARAYRLTGKPIWVAAFGLAAADRGAAYSQFVRALAATPAVFGFDWNDWSGPQGLVNAAGEPNAVFTAAVAQANAAASQLHSQAK